MLSTDRIKIPVVIPIQIATNHKMFKTDQQVTTLRGGNGDGHDNGGGHDNHKTDDHDSSSGLHNNVHEQS